MTVSGKIQKFKMREKSMKLLKLDHLHPHWTEKPCTLSAFIVIRFDAKYTVYALILFWSILHFIFYHILRLQFYGSVRFSKTVVTHIHFWKLLTWRGVSGDPYFSKKKSLIFIGKSQGRQQCSAWKGGKLHNILYFRSWGISLLFSLMQASYSIMDLLCKMSTICLFCICFMDYTYLYKTDCGLKFSSQQRYQFCYFTCSSRVCVLQ